MHPKRIAIIIGGVVAANVAVWWRIASRGADCQMIRREIRDELHRRDIADLRALSQEYVR